ncbi:hypothetical protein A0H81_12325 [Grifola frondosa]|uniref:Uncharacterized protein n=1 Tax=Grifola frondosa TaxID=5627 RepID=A0A1C7LSL5_GRIFR|nr:hypothetical protein A0H81_12325 [Grifola frondosa]
MTSAARLDVSTLLFAPLLLPILPPFFLSFPLSVTSLTVDVRGSVYLVGFAFKCFYMIQTYMHTQHPRQRPYPIIRVFVALVGAALRGSCPATAGFLLAVASFSYIDIIDLCSVLALVSDLSSILASLCSIRITHSSSSRIASCTANVPPPPQNVQYLPSNSTLHRKLPCVPACIANSRAYAIIPPDHSMTDTTSAYIHYVHSHTHGSVLIFSFVGAPLENVGGGGRVGVAGEGVLVHSW